MVLLLLTAAYFRASGLYRGLSDGVVFHPDSPKQVLMLSSYLQGKHVQYKDSLFYDGYPYGLNRVDAIFIRPAHALYRALGGMLAPDAAPSPRLERSSLYYWVRTLRVFYGLATLFLLYLVARGLQLGRWPALGGVWLLALAPLALTVTRSATGDVGVDLFLTLAIGGMVVYAAAGRMRWIAAAAAACGMAYACKYQGGIGLWLVGMPPLLCWLQGREGFRRLLREGLAAVAGFAAGVLALTPAFFVNPRRTWRDMWANFAFIRDYGVPADFLERSPGERVAHGLSRNVPFIAGTLGWTLSLITLLTLAWLIREAIRDGRWRQDGPEANGDSQNRRQMVTLSAVSFPVLALLLSTAFKPAVQPFHFSYLLPFMALAAALLLQKSRLCRPVVPRLFVLLLVMAAGLEAIAASCREDFFWRRGETVAAGRQFARGVFRYPPAVTHRYDPEQALKHFFVEPSRLPVFRNRPSGLHHPAADWWSSQHILPVPSVPLPTTSEWIFVNGPVFPRNDRLFMVPAGDRDWVRRTLVFESLPNTLSLGLRTGRFPSRYEIRYSGRTLHGYLPPQSQEILILERPRAVYPHQEQTRSAFPVPLRVKSALGPVWLTLLGNDAERAVFTAFGPPERATDAPELPLKEVDTLRARLADLLYVDGANLLLAPGRSTTLLPAAEPLAAGPYRLDLSVINPAAETSSITLAFADRSGFATGQKPETFRIPSGAHEITWRFQKPYAPYDANLLIETDGESMMLQSWRLVPDAERLPSWLRADHPLSEDKALPMVDQATPVHFPGLGMWRGLQVPEMIKPGRAFDYTVRFDLDPRIDQDIFHEAVLFLHLKTARGDMVAAFDYPLRKAAMTPDRIPWQRGQWPADLAPGIYRIDAGIYNVRTRKRYGFAPEGSLPMDRRRRYFLAADLETAAAN